MRDLVVTVDVESLPSRSVAGRDNVETLVWGRDGPDAAPEDEYGIGAMMRLGTAHGVPMTMFFEFTGVERYGPDYAEIGAQVLEAGHDLHLHLHPESLPDAFWTERGTPPPVVRPKEYGAEHADLFVDVFAERWRAAYGRKPLAYRGGSFTFTRPIMEAVVRNGVELSSNHAYATFGNRGLVPLAPADLTHFVWEGGLMELGVSQTFEADQHWNLALPRPGKLKYAFASVLKALADAPREAGPVVMLLHSWSFLDYKGGKRFESGGSAHRLSAFERVLARVSEHFEPISLTEAHARAKAGAYDLPTGVRLPDGAGHPVEPSAEAAV